MTVDAPTPKVPAKPWRRWSRRVGITLVVTLTLMALLCCAGAVYVGYDGYRAPREEKAMETFAEDLCQALTTGDLDAVYASLSSAARERHSREELAQGLAARGLVTQCDVLRASYLFLLTYYVMIETSNGPHTFDLVKETGEWRVESDILADLDRPPRHGGGGGFGD